MKPRKDFSIRRFFAEKSIFLTGATGFLAKALAEKILRDLPEVRRLYLLIRPRVRANGMLVSAAQRLRDELLANSAFDRLRSAHGDRFDDFIAEKVVCLEGDLSRERLGLSERDYAALADEVEVVINSAATVVFDERLDWALELNTLSPLRLLELARAAKGTFVHVSTAYVSGQRTGRVPERLPDPLEAIAAQLPPDAPRPTTFEVWEEIERLREICRAVKADCAARLSQGDSPAEKEALQAAERRALSAAGMRRAHSLGWNDTYTYTKFLGEQLLHAKRGETSVAVVRPSIIESSLHEPEPGWLDGLRMADPLIVGFGKGRLSDFPMNPNVPIDIIPADLVVNATLAAAAHVGGNPGTFDLIHVAGAADNPLTCGAMYRHVKEYFRRRPLLDRAGRPVRVPQWKFPSVGEFKRRIRNRYLRPLKVAGFLVDGPLPLPGTRRWRNRLRLLNNAMEQIIYYAEIYGPYTNLNCVFETGHARELGEALPEKERAVFGFDARRVHWRRYLQDVHIPGLKRNILRLERSARAEAVLDQSAGGKTAVDGGIPIEAPRPGAARFRGVPRTLVELAAAGRERFGRRTHSEMRRENGSVTRLTYAEFFERAGEWARRLRAKLDLQPGDRVVLWSGNRPEWGLAYLAIARAGGLAVPLDSKTLPQEAAELVRLIEAKAVIVSPAVLRTARETGTPFGPGDGLPPRLNLLRDLAPHPGDSWPFPEAEEGRATLREPRPDTPASILFTSGTTKAPKGVVLTHGNFTANAFSVAEVLEPLPTDRFLSVLPLHHAFEFTGGFLCPQTAGAEVHYLEALRGPDVMETMKRVGITVMLGVPRLFAMFADGIRAKLRQAGPTATLALAALDKAGAAAELFGREELRQKLFHKIHAGFGGKLRLFVSGGAALDPELFRFFKRFGIPIVEGYGLTETSPVLTVNPKDSAVPGSVGPPLPGVELRLRTPDRDGIGEVLARGPNVMSGYWRNPEATAAVFEDGWFRTGDLGRFDKAGRLYLTGRLKDVIVTSSGKNVYPDEVEAALGLPEGVKEYCIVGLPNRSGTGEEVALVAVLASSAGAEDEEARRKPAAAFEKAARRLPSHCRPTRLEFSTEELPKTSTLKVQRAKVRERMLAPVKHKERGRAAAGTDLAPATAVKGKTGSRAVNFDELLHEVVKIVAAVAGVPEDEVDPDRKLQLDLGIDSLGLVDLVGRLEVRFAVSLPESAVAELRTVRDAAGVVEAALKHGWGRDGGTTSLGRLWRRTPKGGIAALSTEPSLSKNLLQGAFHLGAELVFSTYLPLECHGVGRVPRNGAYILAANHSSHLDTGAVVVAVGERARHLHVMGAKDYFFDTPFKRWFFPTFFNALPLDREERIRDSLAICRMVLDAGRPILIYPEGTRSRDGEIQPLKPGLGVLGVELDVPIIPVHIRGTFASLPKGRTMPRPARVAVRFGPPVDLSELKRECTKLRLAVEDAEAAVLAGVEESGGGNGASQERAKKMRKTEADAALKEIYRRTAAKVQEAMEKLAERAARAEQRRAAIWRR